MPFFHQTARCFWPDRPFLRRELAQSFWQRLRIRFPTVLASVTMPDHVHQIVEADSAASVTRGMQIEMSAFARRHFPGRSLWQPAPPALLIPDWHHLRRQIRYVLLNPCRAGLALDPLEWEWSTHRDSIGATQSPWVDLDRLREIWKAPPSTFARDFHRYVSSDPSVHVAGTPLPVRAPGDLVAAPLELIEAAVIQATRAPSEALFESKPVRRLIFLAARQLGAFRHAELAEWARVSSKTVCRSIAAPPTSTEGRALEASFLLLTHPQRFSLLEMSKKGTNSRP